MLFELKTGQIKKDILFLILICLPEHIWAIFLEVWFGILCDNIMGIGNMEQVYFKKRWVIWFMPLSIGWCTLNQFHFLKEVRHLLILMFDIKVSI